MIPFHSFFNIHVFQSQAYSFCRQTTDGIFVQAPVTGTGT